MKLVRPKIGHFKAVMAADKDFASAGEETYTGCKGMMGYVGWLSVVDRMAKPEVMDWGENPNEIYFMVNDAGEICGFGQLRLYDTPDALSWAGHIGYSVPPSKRNRGYARQMLRMLLHMGFERGRKRILLTCDVDNEPSRRVIEAVGGRFEGYYHDAEYHKRLYWFYKEG